MSVNTQLIGQYISNGKLQNFQFVEQGSFITCFTAVNSDNEKVVLIVSDNIQELQTRFDLARKLGDIEGVQKLYGLQKLEIQDSALEQLEAEYPGIFSKDSHVLTGRYYATQYNDHVRQLSLPQKLDFFRELLVLVKQVHDKGVYHMDLKPSNIMVEDGKPVLIDFGQSVTEAEVDSVLNTSAYAPKHDVYSCNVIPEKFDIYCLGNMLHEIYTGQPLQNPLTPGSKQFTQTQQQLGFTAFNMIAMMTKREQIMRSPLQIILSDLNDEFENSKLGQESNFVETNCGSYENLPVNSSPLRQTVYFLFDTDEEDSVQFCYQNWARKSTKDVIFCDDGEVLFSCVNSCEISLDENF
ncbi:Kinase [Hexamita inflata]|uniref:CAMK CAMKL n=1 Tax=Hexamita inflata TaxID=28002 RepID=A0AA86QP91_9EUKA|nr:CAMK CAMKL [Hexamita inflata]